MIQKNNSFEGIDWLNDLDIQSTAASNLDGIDDMSLREQKKVRYGQDTKYRSYLAIWVMWVVSVWLLCVIAIIGLCGFGTMHLDGTVLVTLLATTTVNVLGLAYIVLRGIFR